MRGDERGDSENYNLTNRTKIRKEGKGKSPSVPVVPVREPQVAHLKVNSDFGFKSESHGVARRWGPGMDGRKLYSSPCLKAPKTALSILWDVSDSLSLVEKQGTGHR